MLKILLETLGAGLRLWEHKDKTKYVDRLIKLKKQYYEEFNKPESSRSDAVLDNLEFELRLVAIGFAATVEGATPDEPK